MKANTEINTNEQKQISANVLNLKNQKQTTNSGSSFKGQRKNGGDKYKKPHGKKPFKKEKNTDNRPPFAFLSIELTGLEQKTEKIIRISEIIKFADGETEKNTYLFNCGDHPISEESTKYHGITAKDLVGKPSITTYDFKKAKNIVVWDSRVVFSMLQTNGIKEFSPMISLHGLARHISKNSQSISLSKYASICEPNLKNIIEFKLKNPLNKVDALTSIFNNLEKSYSEKYECKNISSSFLFKIGRCRNSKEFNSTINNELEKLKAWNVQIEKRKSTTENSSDNGNQKKVIIVKKDESNPNQQVKKKVIIVAKKAI